MVRTDTLEVIGEQIKLEIKNSRQTIKDISILTSLDPKTINKAYNGQKVTPNVIHTLSSAFNVPVSFFTEFMRPNDIYFLPLTNWSNYFSLIQFDLDFDFQMPIGKDKIKNDKIKSLVTKIDEFISIRSHLKETSNKIKKSIEEKLLPFERMDLINECIELGEEVKKSNINIYFSKYIYWEKSDKYSHSYQDGYIAYRKHFLDFRENNNPILMNVNCGDIPTCPYKYYQEGGNNRDIYLHYYDHFDVPKKYSFTDFPFSNIENQNDLQIQDQDEEPF